MTDYPPQYFLSEGPDSITIKVIRSLAGSETVIELPRHQGGHPAYDRDNANKVMKAFEEVDRLSKPAPAGTRGTALWGEMSSEERERFINPRAGDLTGTHPPPRIVVTDQLAQRLADRFWIIIQEQRHGTDIGAALLAAGNHGGGWQYFKQALEEALAAGPVQPVDLRPQYPQIAATVARASAAWPGDYSSIAVALMDGCTTMQPHAADAIASLILLLQSVTKSPEILSPELQERAKEAQNWRRQQGDTPQWSAG